MNKIIAVVIAILLTGCVAEEIAAPSKDSLHRVVKATKEKPKVEKTDTFVEVKTLKDMVLSVNEEKAKIIGIKERPIVALEVQLMLNDIRDVQGMKIKSYVMAIFVDCLNDQAMISKTSGFDETGKSLFEANSKNVVDNPQDESTPMTAVFEYTCPHVIDLIEKSKPEPGLTI